jgi:hypothetical protein
MTQYAIALPDSLFKAAHIQALRDEVSVDHYISLALGEKLSALQSLDRISGRALSAQETAQWNVLMQSARKENPRAGDELVRT